MHVDVSGPWASARHKSAPSKQSTASCEGNDGQLTFPCRKYVKITKTFTLEAAKAFSTLATVDEPFNFVYVSGNGATTEPGRFSAIFARVKGETELALAALRKDNPNLYASSVRPAYVDAGDHAAIASYVPQRPFVHRFFEAFVGPPVKFGYRSLHSPTEPLGRFLTEIALGKHRDQFVAGKGVQMVGSFPILENSVLRQLAGLS